MSLREKLLKACNLRRFPNIALGRTSTVASQVDFCDGVDWAELKLKPILTAVADVVDCVSSQDKRDLLRYADGEAHDRLESALAKLEQILNDAGER